MELNKTPKPDDTIIAMLLQNVILMIPASIGSHPAMRQ
jgi:hypothetical protein